MLACWLSKCSSVGGTGVSLQWLVANGCHMLLQLLVRVGEQDVDSEASESCDIITTTSNLSEEVSSDLTAERRRELWRRAHLQHESKDVQKQQI